MKNNNVIVYQIYNNNTNQLLDNKSFFSNCKVGRIYQGKSNALKMVKSLKKLNYNVSLIETTLTFNL